MNNLDIPFDEDDEFADMMSDLPTEFDNNTFPDSTPRVLDAEHAFEHFFNQHFNNSFIPFDDENL